jgi:hypothetical protein
MTEEEESSLRMELAQAHGLLAHLTSKAGGELIIPYTELFAGEQAEAFLISIREDGVLLRTTPWPESATH